MKKILTATLIFVILFANLTIEAEEQPEFSIAEKIKSFMLINYPESLAGVQKTIKDRNDEMFVERVELEYFRYNDYTEEELEGLYDYWYKNTEVIPEKAFCFYPMITARYSKQYADSFCFDELISDEKIWVAVRNAPDTLSNSKIKDSDFVERSELRGVQISDGEAIEFIQDPEKIEHLVKESVDEEIIDCKIVVPIGSFVTDLSGKGDYHTNFYNVATILYLKGQSEEYGIILYDGREQLFQFKNSIYDNFLDKFKTYLMSDILNSYTEIYDAIKKEVVVWHGELLDTKPTYEAEAIALQNDGLLQGNEKGLDLLKPLSRIEATTILVRALGLENEQTDTASKFVDIPDGNWGVKYANIAYDKGITRGIGDDKFAPDDLITSTQFSTLLLRNFESEEFDWQTATNLLIEKGIITAENAETMDLFTRGDMAKIIYEARTQGLIN